MRLEARCARGAATTRGDVAVPLSVSGLRLRRGFDPLSGTYGAPGSPHGDRLPHPQVCKEAVGMGRGCYANPTPRLKTGA
jgi:hypothetical protein